MSEVLEFGSVVSATVKALEEGHVVVNVDGIEKETRIPQTTLRGLGELKAGDAIEVFVENPSPDSFTVSQKMAWGLGLWDKIEAAASKGQWVEGEVVGSNPGGLVVDVGVRGFVPNKLARMRGHENLQNLVGTTQSFKVVKLDKKRGEVMLSRREVLDHQRKADAERTLRSVSAGDVVEGTVVSFTDYGAFVDIGGVDGLIHNSDLSWGRVSKPDALLRLGDKIQTKILNIDSAKAKVGLGLKQMSEDPWHSVKENYPVGKKMSGTVVSLKDYGAFVLLEDGVEGMVHVSEMSWTERLHRASDKFKVGDTIEVLVLDLDEKERRIALGHKQTVENPWHAVAAKYPEGTKMTAKVVRKTDFGVFVEVQPGIDGLIHMSDLAWEGSADDALAAIEQGTEIESVVRRVDAEAQRLSLSVKHLSEDPWKSFAESNPKGTKVTGTVKSIQEIGCVVDVQGIEGFCHIGELAEERVERVRQVVSVGAEKEFAIKDIDLKKRRLSLSIKLLTTDVGDYRKHMKDETPDGPSPFASKLGAALSKD